MMNANVKYFDQIIPSHRIPEGQGSFHQALGGALAAITETRATWLKPSLMTRVHD